MSEAVQVAGYEMLASQIAAQIGRSVDVSEIKLVQYALDTRNNWDTYLVTVVGFGPVGYTDGPLR
jgi:hypothetical protein